MENKPTAPCLSSSRSQNVLKKYHQITSPLVSLQLAKKQDNMKQEIRHNVSMKLDCIKNRGSKIYAVDNSLSYAELKAGATLYQIPEFSVPEVNFEVSDQIRKKVQQAKKEIISYFPQISRSSNYAPKKIQHQLSHRSAVRQLEEWLNEKLKNPPINSQESIEYKNMIMGVGMKELIRIISKRCIQQGRMAEEIWQLTWNICREIILYLSKRAKKCQKLLEQELFFMRSSYEKEYERLNSQNTECKQKIKTLQQQNKQFLNQLIKLRKKRQLLQQDNKSLNYNNFHLQGQFKKVLQQNLAIYLQIGDKNKRGWIKKMYKNINQLSQQSQQNIKNIYKNQIKQVIQQRNQLEQITGQSIEQIHISQIQSIGNKKYKNKNKKYKKNKWNRISKNNENILITQQSLQNQNNQQQSQSQSQCIEMINNMRQQFLPIEAQMQTDSKKFQSITTNTQLQQYSQQSCQVNQIILGNTCQFGINTQQIKQQITKIIKKKGKQNSKQQSRSKQKSKNYTSPSNLRQKIKQKQKDKKSVFDIIPQSNIDNKIQQKDELISFTNIINQQINTSPSKKNIINIIQYNPFDKKTTSPIPNNTQLNNITLKTNSTILAQNQQKQINIINEQNKKTNKQQYNKQQIKLLAKSSRNEYNKDQLDKQIHSLSFDNVSNKIKQYQQRNSKLQSINQCNIYICSQCHKILTSLDQKYNNPKIKSNYLQKSIQNKSKTYQSYKKLSVYDQDDQLNDKKNYIKKYRKQNRKNSSYIHDIGFKKQMEQQSQQQSMKNTFYNNSKDQTYQKYENNQQQQSTINIYNKISPYKLLFLQLIQQNKIFIQNIVTIPIQLSQNLQNYFELVRQVNILSDNKSNISQKSAISIIQKNIFPILNQLLNIVKKSVKTNKIYQTIKIFTSLPNIIYNRINRKYGVKILAIKNLKILLIALKQAGKFTQKYKIIELMMFTDCKSPHSQDLYIYLFIMAIFDPNFTSQKYINYQQTQNILKICQDYLTKQPIVYQQFNKLRKQNQSILLINLVKSIITNYRLLKINRIQQIGFIYLMLKKDHYMSYKKFIYFLSTLNINNNIKLKISKKLLQYCDIKNKDQRVVISQIMFSKFLMNCQEFNFIFLQDIINQQLIKYKQTDKNIVDHLTLKFFKSQKNIKTKYQFENKIDQKRISLQNQNIRQSISIPQPINSLKITSTLKQQIDSKQIQSISVLKQIKQYSSFTYHICKYLQNNQQTKYLNIRQQLFIKNYLIIHIIQSQIEKTIGLIDYFSNSMIDVITTNHQQFNINYKYS